MGDVRCRPALEQFGASAAIIDPLRGLGPEEFLYLGAAPVRVDILRGVVGISFPEAYAHRETAEWDGVAVSVIGFDDLVAAQEGGTGWLHTRPNPSVC